MEALIGPSTSAHNTFIDRNQSNINERIEFFKETGEPVSLWEHKFLLSGSRGIKLTEYELDHHVYSVLHMCGVEGDYMKSLKLFKVDDDEPKSPSEAMLAGGMGPSAINSRLADAKALWKEFANDYKTALLFDTPLGLVAFKCTAEEEGVLCMDCHSRSQDIDTDFYVEPGHSCDHYEGEVDIEFQYQISLFPKTGLENVRYTINGFPNVP